MSLIKKGSDFRYEAAIQTLSKQLIKGKCIFFLGAGASIEPAPPSLPTAQELSRDLAKACKLQWYSYIPLSTIAFYYESFFTRQGLNDFLVEKIEPKLEIKPSTTIQRLMDIIDLLQQRRINPLTITTNFDRHFERAYAARFGKPPDILIYKGGWNPNDRTARLHVDAAGTPTGQYWNPQETSLYKMHGCISQVKGQSLVVTEEDYINFLTNALGENSDNRVPWFVRGKLDASTILFLGYGLADWNFRTIFKATVERRENKDIRSYAVQLHEPVPADQRDLLQLVVDFWGEKGIDIINLKADEFITDLLNEVKVELGTTEGHEVNAGTTGA
jgi:SIR2-like protein